MPDITERAKKLSTLLAGVACRPIGDIDDRAVTAIETDSRKVKPGALFVAVAGKTVDGHDYIQQALKNGCVAVVGEKGSHLPDGIPFIEVQDSREALSEIAISFYDNPARNLILIGITGTNGKTTTTYLLEAIIRSGGGNPGVIGTVNYRFNGEEHPALFTTPEPVILQSVLSEMVRGGVSHLVMEVSSHSLIQKRIHGLKFDVALFTNLSRDHLDFHGTMRQYFAAKKILFEKHVKENGKALICCDMTNSQNGMEVVGWGRVLLEELRKNKEIQRPGANFEIISCGFDAVYDLHATDFSIDLQGIRATAFFRGKVINIASALVGEFNLKNILAAVGVGLCLNFPEEALVKGITETGVIPGRLEKVCPFSGTEDKAELSSLSAFMTFRVRTKHMALRHKQGGGLPTCSVFVDYAHTPDALHNVLQTMRLIAKKRIIVVFGCGGDRDRGKRFPMGDVAGRLADVVVITTDNSRSESPDLIMAAIEKGVIAAGKEKITDVTAGNSEGYLLIADRSDAIKYAVTIMEENDVVLIAGKGHENYQITGKQRVFFDDRVEARKQLERRYQNAA
jgi:UDP-N-acetylmuramyl-tripeptide synthetase